MVPKRLRLVAQSAMEYLMTYGWAILIIAVVLAALFELGVFNGPQSLPQACIAQAGFICKNPIYTANGITFTFGQTTGRDYYGDWVFVAAQGEALNQNGIPINFTCTPTGCANAMPVGGLANVLIPGQVVQADFPGNLFPDGGIHGNPPVGTPFAGYVWLGYCFSPCSSPSAYSKVATLTIKSVAGLTGPSSTSTTSTATTTTSTTSTSSSLTTTCSPCYVQITLQPGSTISGTFQQQIQIDPSSYSSSCPGLGGSCVASDLGNIRFYSSISSNVPTGELNSWLESCNSPTQCSSSSNADFWVQVPGESTPNTIIYMVFWPYPGANGEFDGVHAGEAPQLSPSYGQYDNGNNVFSSYQNFAGSSVPPGWQTLASTPSINNGVHFSENCCGGSGWVATTTATNLAGSVFEAYQAPGGSDSLRIFEASGNQQCTASGLYPAVGNAGGGAQTSGCFNNAYAAGGQSTANGGVDGIYWPNSNEYLVYWNYGNESTITASTPTSCCDGGPMTPPTIGNAYQVAGQYFNGGSFTMYWIRTRVYPPGGNMPSVTISNSVQ